MYSPELLSVWHQESPGMRSVGSMTQSCMRMAGSRGSRSSVPTLLFFVLYSDTLNWASVKPMHEARWWRDSELHGRLLRLEVLPKAVAPEFHALPWGCIGRCPMVHKACTCTHCSCDCHTVPLALQAADLDRRSFTQRYSCRCWLDVPYKIVSLGSQDVSAVS